jgi:(1->4)-alpha-D-glucan 1-alpha-D-glucosylmutase
MIYQTLLGAWPLGGPDEGFVERMQAYAIKAAREGKVETSWINPVESYEAALTRFVQRMLDRRESAPFLQSFDRFAQRAALIGALNSLSQLVLKATMPGVPDFYQGNELWDLSLVDPDNRRPVDFAARAAALASLAAAPDWAALAADWPGGMIKLALSRALLALRNRHAELFTHGDYRPVEVAGPHREHVIAFARTLGRDAIVVAVGRHFAGVTEQGRRWPDATAWEGGVALDGLASVESVLGPDRTFRNHEAALCRLFDPVPVAILRATIPASSRRQRSVTATESAMAG